MSVYGSVPLFDCKSDEWGVHSAQLKNFFVANGINDTSDVNGVKRRAILLNCMSQDSYRLTRDLLFPIVPESATYSVIVDTLDAHFQPKKCIYAERQKFYSAKKDPHESLPEYAARIRGLASTCQFGTSLEMCMTDRFVLGVDSPVVREKLFREDPGQLKLTRAVEVAGAVESAQRVACSDLAALNIKSESVLYAAERTERRHATAGRSRDVGSGGSGGSGHLKRMCASKSVRMVDRNNIKSRRNRNSEKRSNFISECDNESENSDYALLNNIRCSEGAPMTVAVTADGKPFSMEIDSGSAVSAMPSAVWRRYFSKTHPLANKYSSILNKYNSLFSDNLGTFNRYKLTLHLKEGAVPKFCKARTVPFALKDKVSAELDRLVRIGILKPVSYSKYASPIVAVLKKNNEVRICGDYSGTINKILKVDSYPLPKLNELCASLHGCRYFSKLDLSQSYNQFLLDDQSQEYTCINTHKGLFVYTRLVFGLANAPALFQRAMVQLLNGIDGVVCFLDDVLIAASTPELHWERVEQVLIRLRDAGLILQKSKCYFLQEKVEYLGFIIDREGIHKNPDKIRAIIDVKVPMNTKQLKSFLGIVNFYHSFIPQAAALLVPLHTLLRKDIEWEWTDEHQKAFNAVKRELSSSRVLSHYDPRQQLVLTVDAAPSGLGAVLAARYHDGAERPICYASRALNKSERAYSQIQKEATAIIYGIKKFHQYLYGRQQPFILRTDHKPLLSIFSPEKGVPQMTESRLQRYALFLAAYNYKIEFVSSGNNVADYLSRFPVEMEPQEVINDTEMPSYINALAAAGATLPASLEEMRSSTAADITLSDVIQYINKGWPRKVRVELLPYSRCQHELHVDNGCLMRGHRVVVPEVYRSAVIQELHAAHLGIMKMKSLARERCWYPGIDRDIEQTVSNCDRCISVRSAPPKAHMESWNWPVSVFDRIHLDYLGPLSSKIFLVLVDAHSKWIECLDMPNMTSQSLILNLKKVFSRFGLPKTIVTDNATTFTSSEFGKFCDVNGITHILSPVYSPQSNGLAENAVKTCKRFIKNALKDCSIKNIGSRLDDYLFYYRNTPHCTTGVSPSVLMFGRNLRCKLDLISVRPSATGPNPMLINNRVRLNQERQRRCFGGKGRYFSRYDKVWIRDYRFNPKRPVWVLGSVVSRVGKVVYDVAVKDTDIVWRRHINQLLDAKTYNGNVNSSAWSYDKYDNGTTCSLTHDLTTEPFQSDSPTTAPGLGVEGEVRPSTPAGSPEPRAPNDADYDSYGTPPNEAPERSPPRAASIPGVRRTRSGRPVHPPKRLFF
ncbi:uncharacterized protein K02A2.6-like [Galleria mellonella]|uniref:RNA-directed DNA polymerase n=1 Tax=Galleria mellonella TaxID=7137 RepID=A0ABM3MCL5_GALME|nr:uncharacterized protein K02A2.6-like [Galleria mellonella]